jgi:hypothetical protein
MVLRARENDPPTLNVFIIGECGSRTTREEQKFSSSPESENVSFGFFLITDF